MANAPELPEGIDETYENTGVREALRQLLDTPDYEHLAAFLMSLREGFLVVDITGAMSKKKGARVRTIRSTNGQLVLPIFTSMEELRAVVPASRSEEIKALTHQERPVCRSRVRQGNGRSSHSAEVHHPRDRR